MSQIFAHRQCHARRLWNASIVSMLLFEVIKVGVDVSNASYQPFLSSALECGQSGCNRKSGC